MALLFLDSFDHYQTAEATKKWTNVTGGATIETGVGRCDTNALQLDGPSSVNRGLEFSGSTVLMGFAWQRLSAGSAPAVYFALAAIADGSGRTFISLYHQADGGLALVLPNDDGGSDRIIATTAPNLIHLDTWYFIEWKVALDPAAGSAVVRVNNVAQITYSGKTMSTWPSGVGILPPRIVGLTGVINQLSLVDDFYVLDASGSAPQNDLLGDVRIEFLKPRAAGANQTWPTLVGAASHWQAVKDATGPDGDTSYVEATTSGLTDTNLYDPTGLPSGQPIYGAQLSLYARKTEIGPRVIAPVVNGVTGPSAGPSYETYQYFTTPYGTNPAGGAAWTPTSINAIDAGVTVVS